MEIWIAFVVSTSNIVSNHMQEYGIGVGGWEGTGTRFEQNDH